VHTAKHDGYSGSVLRGHSWWHVERVPRDRPCLRITRTGTSHNFYFKRYWRTQSSFGTVWPGMYFAVVVRADLSTNSEAYVGTCRQLYVYSMLLRQGKYWKHIQTRRSPYLYRVSTARFTWTRWRCPLKKWIKSMSDSVYRTILCMHQSICSEKRAWGMFCSYTNLQSMYWQYQGIPSAFEDISEYRPDEDLYAYRKLCGLIWVKIICLHHQLQELRWQRYNNRICWRWVPTVPTNPLKHFTNVWTR